MEMHVKSRELLPARLQNSDVQLQKMQKGGHVNSGNF